MARGRRSQGFAARPNRFELVNVKPLVDDPNLEVDTIRRRQIDPDLVNVEPNQQPLDLYPLEVGDGAVAELTGDGLLVVNHVVELDVARLGQIDDESAVVGEGVPGDGVGQEAAGEAVLGEDVVGRFFGGGEGEG